MRLIVTVGGLDSIVTLRTLELSQLSLLILQTIRRKISGRADEEKMITVRLCKALMVNCQNISFSDKWLFDWKKKLLSFCFYNNSYRKCSLQTLQGRMTNVEGREGRGAQCLAPQLFCIESCQQPLRTVITDTVTHSRTLSTVTGCLSSSCPQINC